MGEPADGRPGDAVATVALPADGAAPASPQVTVEVTATPVLGHAMAHNRVPVVPRLAITPGESVRAAGVRLTVRDAEGPIATTAELLVDLDAGRTTVLTDVDLTVDPAAVAQVEHQRPGVVEVEVTDGDRVLGGARVGVSVLAAQQWLASPVPLALEMLAAHVLPHHPAIPVLLDEAADLLEQRTGSRAISGYAAGPERVDQTVRALADAVRARGIGYSEPPASWVHLGQQVRTPGDVLTWRVGTALDLVLLLAAALERAGIRPLVWLADGLPGPGGHGTAAHGAADPGGTGARLGAGGHAFLGYWRDERSAESAATTDVAPLAELVEAGLVGLVETTLLTALGEPGADLHEPAHAAWLAGGPDRVLGVTDVHRARRDGIRPLPARARDAEGVLHVVEYAAAEHGGPAHPAPPRAPGSTRPEPPPRVQQWKNALLDLSLRNRLINYTERSGLGLAVPGPALGILANFVSDGTPITLLPADRLTPEQQEGGLADARQLPAEQRTQLLVDRREVHAGISSGGYLPRLRALAHKARTVVEETGANNLYLALGSLVWELDGRPLRSPLVLVPVTLTATVREGTYRLALDESGTSTPNHCLLEKLRQLHGLAVPTLPEPADGSLDVASALEAVRLALVGHRLPFRVEETADLAILQFAKFRLWKDLDEHWADLASSPLVAHLVEQPPADQPSRAFADPVPEPGPVDLDELAARCPVPADASQLRAIAEAAAGRTFVLEGPPGTGKSQTITNLLARAVAEGKRVLFVAEKRAALDVVARRLEAVGLGPFALDLHDKAARASTVRAQVRAALEHATDVDEQALAADAGALRAARGTLDDYAEQLHTPNAAGLSLYSARTAELAAGADVVPLPVPAGFVASAPVETLTAVRRALGLLPDISDLTRPSPRHPWAFVDTPDVDLPAAQAAAVEVDAAVRELTGFPALAQVLRHARTPEDLDALGHLLAGPPVGLDVLDETFAEMWTAATSAVLGEVAAFTAFRHPGLDVCEPGVLALPLAEVYVAAQTAAASGWVGRQRRLTAVRDRLAPHVRTGATLRPTDVPAVVEALWRVQTAVHQIAARAASVPGLVVPPDWNPFNDPGLLDRQVQWLRRAGAAVDGATPFHVALRRLVVAGTSADPAAARAGARLRDALTALLDVCRSTPERLAAWAGDDGFLLRWSMTRPERGVEHSGLMSLRRWVSLLDTLQPLRAAGLDDARRMLVRGEVPAGDAVRAFDRGVAAASIAERREATGLTGFAAEEHERVIGRFTATARAVRARLAAALPAAVIAGRPAGATSGDGPVDALTRELAAQRRGLGVRALLAEHGELITSVMPCVLVSPDSVARFFPARAGLFDLVVFDEASQIRVAEAVGALGRARAAVVVGDSRQLPPTTFFAEPSSDDEATDLDGVAVEDEESILSECVQAGVPRQWLTWHYRSQDESLIAFSNAAYYGNRLSSFPAPSHGRASADPTGRGVALVRVQGTFHRSGAGRLLRTNPLEARAVVAEIRRRFELSRGAPPSIGVVTFNAQQRSYIEGLLRDADDARLAEALDRTDGEGIFVKNLENVQGDERDVVLFSTGFSPDESGRLPLNFGPLNRVGGERRLNVAVTRARRQVVVFSSFDPEQLRAEETSSVGVKHLRAYLDMAAHGTDVLPSDLRPSPAVDRHREQLAAALRARGVVVRTAVGLSEFKVDLVVARAADPDVPVMAVLLDGPAWAGRGTVGDRDGLPVEVLGGMLGWPVVERVWLPAWLADPHAVLDRLVARLHGPPVEERLAEVVELPRPRRRSSSGSASSGSASSGSASSGSAAPEAGRVAALRAVVGDVVAAPVPKAKPSPRTRKAPTPAPALDGETPFVPWTPRTAGEKAVLDALPEAKAARAVRRVLAAGIKAEGPVHVDRLAKLTAGAFGLSRVTDARRAVFLSLLPPSAVENDVCWPEALERPWTGFRRQATSAERPLDHVPVEEVGNAMVALCRASTGMARDELLTAAAQVFGYKRRTPTLTPALERALHRVLERGRLVEQSSGLFTAG
ncbi:DUF4011 domain-containing protein [Geodermatophilus sp. YIM 151500]|uniref:DUF4011 domain-containing protein n=1 Tax=Geodermatophilus sp. YIM 151500 TaxID=2984531 RepID=UPI0021E40C58|nr:DUF4011 domain-containing protein [Geodermatophilus sp. YIM 151500]MCV2488187.1 DUF4011 domain-containing protein [Geodermatophilus sp. YIM 151500]